MSRNESSYDCGNLYFINEFLIFQRKKMNFNSNLNSTSTKNTYAAHEQSFFHKIQAEFKATVYGSLYVVLKEEPFPAFFVMLIYVIYFIQLLYIPLHPMVILIFFSILHWLFLLRFKRFGMTTRWVIILVCHLPIRWCIPFSS